MNELRQSNSGGLVSSTTQIKQRCKEIIVDKDASQDNYSACDVGRIVSFGDPMQTKNLQVGQLVAYFSGAGTHQAFTVASIDRTHPVDETPLSRYAGLFVQPSVGANALNQAGINSGDTVLVVGQGLIGQFTAALARQRGAYVVTTELSQERIAISKKYCADQVFDTSVHGAWDAIRAEFPKGFDVVIESTGYLPVVEDSLKCVRFEGVMVFEGYHAGEMKFDYNPVANL